MIEGPTPASPGGFTPARRIDAAENSQAAFRLPSSPGVGQAPPPDLLRALDRAAKVAADLQARQLTVHFEAGADSRVQAQVMDASGKVVRQLPVAQALELLSGEGPSLVDELR